MKLSFHPSRSFRHGVISYEQVRVRCQLRQTFAFAIGISAEDDTLAANLHAPCQRGAAAT